MLIHKRKLGLVRRSFPCYTVWIPPHTQTMPPLPENDEGLTCSSSFSIPHEGNAVDAIDGEVLMKLMELLGGLEDTE